MKIAVTGANGQLGSDICKVLGAGFEVIPFVHDTFDITDTAMMAGQMERVRPNVVINTAAYHHVEKCEEDPLTAFTVNAAAAAALARVCKEHHARLLHISTDYVFSGSEQRPYSESDCPGPLNTYGVSKLAGEWMIRNTWSRSLIIRCSGLYGLHPCRAKGGKNFVELMLGLAAEGKTLNVVDSEIVSPTSTLDLARQIAVLANSGLEGICHATSGGSCSWHAFAAAIFEIEGMAPDLRIAAAGAFAGKVKRPLYSVLENSVLREAGLYQMKHWKEALREYLELRRKRTVA